MIHKLIVYGAGYNGEIIADEYMRHNRAFLDYQLVGFIDDTKNGDCLGFPILGGKETLPDLLDDGIDHIMVTLLSNPVKRLETCLKLEEMGFQFPSYCPNLPKQILPNLPAPVTVGKGVLIDDTAKFLGYNITLGDFCMVSHLATIESGSTLGKGVIIHPYAFVGYDSRIGDSSVLYTRSTCLPQTKIGKNCVIGTHVVAKNTLQDGTKKVRYR